MCSGRAARSMISTVGGAGRMGRRCRSAVHRRCPKPASASAAMQTIASASNTSESVITAKATSAMSRSARPMAAAPRSSQLTRPCRSRIVVPFCGAFLHTLMVSRMVRNVRGRSVGVSWRLLRRTLEVARPHVRAGGDAVPEAAHAHTNRLASETSPYLLQHAHNPVDWYPWGDEAFERAKAEDKPILLSVGYSACHWCHVMAHESFESERIATIMNLHYVCIKVDREERPDVDALYMDAVQALTNGHGGWPMTVWLTPEGLPFFAGTYFPPEELPGYSMPSFPTLLLRLAQFYKTRRDDVEAQAEEFRNFYAKRGALDLPGLLSLPIAASEVDLSVLTTAERNLGKSFDMTQGGFGGAPKFPPAMELEFLLRMHLRASAVPVRLERIQLAGAKAGAPELTPLAMVTRTLDKMAAGGIYDHLGGGFHRYATDDRWLVPHFEKMLYDNALLSRIYLHAHQVTG